MCRLIEIYGVKLRARAALLFTVADCIPYNIFGNGKYFVWGTVRLLLSLQRLVKVVFFSLEVGS